LRIGVFQHAIGGNEEILGEITRELHDIAERFDLTSAERASTIAATCRQQCAPASRGTGTRDPAGRTLWLECAKPELAPGNRGRRERLAVASAALQHCVALYLEQRLGQEQSISSGEKSLKTLRLSQEARSKLLEDFRQLPRSSEPPQRAWEKWLKG
jgi:ATP-dependent helicase HepA